MAIFIRLRQHLQCLGFIAFDVPHGATIRLSLNCLISQFSFVITLAFLVMETEADFNTKVQCACSLMSIFYCASEIILFTLQKQTFFDLMENVQEINKSRKRKYGSIVSTIYSVADTKLELFTSRLIFFVNVIIYIFSFSLTWSYSYYNYYIKDMGADAFIPSVPSK